MAVELKGKNLLLSSSDGFTRVTRWLAITAAACLGVAMLIGTIDVVGTKFLSWPLPGAKEIIEELNVGIVLLAIAFVAIGRGHIRITLLEPYMPTVLSFAFGVFGCVAGILLSAFLSWRAFVLLQSSIQNHILKGGGELLLPVWPGTLICFVGFGFLLMAFVLLLCKKIIAHPK